MKFILGVANRSIKRKSLIVDHNFEFVMVNDDKTTPGRPSLGLVSSFSFSDDQSFYFEKTTKISIDFSL